MSARAPAPVADFLSGTRIAVAGVSRSGKAAANAILKRLRETGHAVVPINPNAAELEGERCYPDLASIPGDVDGLLFAAHPGVAEALVRQAAARGTKRVWFHRSVGQGSVSQPAIDACRELGVVAIVGGCPLMYAGQVDPAHGFMRWLLRLFRRVPG